MLLIRRFGRRAFSTYQQRPRKNIYNLQPISRSSSYHRYHDDEERSAFVDRRPSYRRDRDEEEQPFTFVDRPPRVGRDSDEAEGSSVVAFFVGCLIAAVPIALTEYGRKEDENLLSVVSEEIEFR